jgi:hypothetical protein
MLRDGLAYMSSSLKPVVPSMEPSMKCLALESTVERETHLHTFRLAVLRHTQSRQFVHSKRIMPLWAPRRELGRSSMFSELLAFTLADLQRPPGNSKESSMNNQHRTTL